ncbi:hypothetical protein HMPREF9406_2614 [Clostridium sp. HGF2]|nr:hypothetical protein HMPREF9406_2614 [Clostridium sp. HGF2]BDF01874.1 hypothetical protein CE91St51_39110 [[Clostridium] innocuum]
MVIFSIYVVCTSWDKGGTKPSCDSRLVLAGVSSMVSFLYGKLLCVQQRALLCKCLILKKGDFLFF